MSAFAVSSPLAPLPLSLVLPSRDLESALDAVGRHELVDLAAPSPLEAYSRKTLVDTPELLVVAARWQAGARCDLHGHSESAGLYRVINGRLEEERYVPAKNGAGAELAYEIQTLEAGDESYLPAGSFHQLRARAESITLHAYAPRPEDAVSSLTHEDRMRLEAARRSYGLAASALNGPVRDMRRPFDTRTVETLAAELAERWAEYEAQAYRDESYRVPARVLEDMRASGILAAPLLRQHGGLSASLVETARAVTLIAQRAPAAALAVVMPLGNAATCTIPLSAVAAEHVASLRASQRWVAGQVTRGRILAVANSEPGAGGHLSQTRTTATVGEDGIARLTGRKTFATIGPDADYFLCAARVADAGNPEAQPRVDGFFVHRDAPGLALDDRWSPFGMRPTASVGMQLEDTPAEIILGYPGCLETINARHWSTLLFSAVFLGIGQAALREARQHAGHSPWARAKLAEHQLTLDAADGYLTSVCSSETWPMPKRLLEQVQQVKAFVTQAAVQAATQAAMISGGRAYSPGHPVYRLLADALAGPLLRPPLPGAMDSIMERVGSA